MRLSQRRDVQPDGAGIGRISAQPVPFSVVVVDVSTGAQVTHLADRSVLSASLYKLFVARELIRRMQSGQLDPDAQSGDGMHRTFEQCLEAMIVASDLSSTSL